MKKYKKLKNNFFVFSCFLLYPYIYKCNENMEKYKTRIKNIAQKQCICFVQYDNRYMT